MQFVLKKIDQYLFLKLLEYFRKIGKARKSLSFAPMEKNTNEKERPWNIYTEPPVVLG